ncbi:MAG: hypothetical protein RLZZ573_500 [Pseudomonadota bacterium]
MLKGRATVADSSLIRSPFHGHKTGARPSRAGVVGVHLSASTLASVTLVSTWHSGILALGLALDKALGQTMPERNGQVVQADAAMVMRTGPEEFMLVSDRPADMTAFLRQTIRADVGSVTNLSHARCRIQIQGEKCLETLSKLFALDLREEAFPLHEIRLTGHHHVPCTLHRRGAMLFDMYVFSTYAHDQLATLLDAALEYGVNLKSTG